MQWVVLGEAFIDNFQEGMADVGGYISVVGWVKPRMFLCLDLLSLLGCGSKFRL